MQIFSVKTQSDNKTRYELEALCENFRKGGIEQAIYFMYHLCNYYNDAETPDHILAEYETVKRVMWLRDTIAQIDHRIDMICRSEEQTQLNTERLKLEIGQRTTFQERIYNDISRVNIAMLASYLREKAVKAGDLIVNH